VERLHSRRSTEELQARRQEKDAERRERLDLNHGAEFAQQILGRYPSCPQEIATAIAEHACLKHSERFGQTAAAKVFAPETMDLAVIAHIRHTDTQYDTLLMRGWKRGEAREAIAPMVQATLVAWRQA
jgi:hypothetical protein